MAHRRRALVSWLIAALPAAVAAQDVQMRHLARGMTTERTGANAFMVIRTADDLARALNRNTNLDGGQELAGGRPTIDFGTEMAVGVMLADRPTACTGVEITGITKDGIVSVVRYRERLRKPHEPCAVTVTSPFDLVAIPKSGAPIRFQADGER